MGELQDLFEQSNPIPKGITRCGDHYAQTEYVLIDPYASNYAARFKGFMEGVNHQQAIIDDLRSQQKRIGEALFEMRQLSLILSKDIDGYEDPAQVCQSEGVDMGVKILEKAMRGANETN